MGMLIVSARQKCSIFRIWMKNVFEKRSFLTSIEDLPNELIVQICGHLRPSDRRSMSRVSRRFSQLIDKLGYITSDTLQVHIDFVNQIVLVVWKDSTACSVCLNGDLPQNKGLKAAGRSHMLESFPAKLYKVVRNVRDKWIDFIWIYLSIMKRELAQSVLAVLRIVFPPDFSPYITQVMKLREVKIDCLVLCRNRREDDHVNLPEELYFLLKNSKKFWCGFGIEFTETFLKRGTREIGSSPKEGAMSVFLVQISTSTSGFQSTFAMLIICVDELSRYSTGESILPICMAFPTLCALVINV